MSNTNFQIEELLLDYLDGNLEGSKKAFVERYLAQNPAVAEELGILKVTKLIPDVNLVYDNKESLKRSKERSLPFILRYSVAAGGALLIGLALWVNLKESMVKDFVASIPNKIETQINANQNKNTKSAVSEEFAMLENADKVVYSSAVSGATKGLIHNSRPKSKSIQSNYNGYVGTVNGEIVASQTENLENNLSVISPLNKLHIEDIKSLNLQYKPVIIYEQELVYEYEVTNSLRNKVRAFLPENLVYIETEVKKTIHDVSIVPLTDKLRNAFQIDKLKEALVPTSIQENLTTL